MTFRIILTYHTAGLSDNSKVTVIRKISEWLHDVHAPGRESARL